MAKNTKKEWLSTSDVARLCGATAQAVRIWIDSGMLPASVFGRAMRKVRRADAEAFVNAARVRKAPTAIPKERAQP